MLSELQKRFADYYIETGNASESYKRAGYKAKGKSIEVNASRLLTNAKVKLYIDNLIASKDSERIAKQDEVLEFLTRVLRGEMDEEFALGVGKGAQEIIRKELDGKERIKAAELLGKRYAIWTDRQHLEGNVGVTIVDDIDES